MIPTLPSPLLALLRCPWCKGPLTAGAATLSCAACRSAHPWDDGLGCWDLRPHPLGGSAPTERTTGTGAARRSPGARHRRMWRALHAVHPELPRQGTVLRVDPPDGGDPGDLADAFRHALCLVTRPGSREPAPGAGPVALVDPCFLPIASHAVDLVDGELLDAPSRVLERRLTEVHRVLAPAGHAYLTGRARSSPLRGADRAARSAFADGFAWVPAALGAVPGAATAAALHRHLQSWVGFEYTLGRGIQAAGPTLARRWLVRLRSERELVCWRTRPSVSDWKSTPSDEPMVFGRFHFPASAPPA